MPTWEPLICWGAKGVIFHLGSHRGAGYDARVHQVADYVARVIAGTPEDTWLILENSAGMGGAVGSRFRELGQVAREAASERVKICLDTQHAFAAGYDQRTAEAVERTMEEFDREAGIRRLVALHANDSKCPLGGGLDRHANIGEGYIGGEGFENILAYPAFADLPFILEVPGYADEGPDKANVDALKDIRSRLAHVTAHHF